MIIRAGTFKGPTGCVTYLTEQKDSNRYIATIMVNDRLVEKTFTSAQRATLWIDCQVASIGWYGDNTIDL